MFITFEGIDGAGKSTQIKLLSAQLASMGIEYIETHDPGGTEFAKALRSVILSREHAGRSPLASLFSMAACRADLWSKVIHPALNDDKIVLCDRFSDSTYAYQTMEGVDEKTIDAIENIMGLSHISRTIFLDLPPSIAWERLQKRSETDFYEGRGQDHLWKLRESYYRHIYKAKNRDRFLIIDATKSVQQIHQEIWKDIELIIRAIGDYSLTISHNR